MSRIALCCVAMLCACFTASAQSPYPAELTAPLLHNAAAIHPAIRSNTAAKPTLLTLPFFEDFTDYSPYPNATRWSDSEVYINNTMAVDMISRGVATFDALNKLGRPYDTANPGTLLFADSLTSEVISLNDFAPDDSVYLSFFVQPQGRGFSPEVQDSLMLFFLNSNNAWVRVWYRPGSGYTPFQQVMIPVADTQFFHTAFRFRFVNKASIGINDDIWNLDYIRMDQGRSINDTAVSDLAFTTSPTPLLNDYTSMPYRHFIVATDAERAGLITAALRNNYAVSQAVTTDFVATDSASGTLLGTVTPDVIILPPYSASAVSVGAYTGIVPMQGIYDRVSFDQVYYLQSPPNEPKDNDTILHRQVFDNYFAYDDGTAEKSYFLNQFPTLPAKLGIEFRLNIPDTVRGFMVYFGQQVPTSSSKFFSMAVAKNLAGVNGAGFDEFLYEQPFLQPVFAGSVNGFSVYRLDEPVALPAGTFYLVSTQPAQSGSDSLYYGLDLNRVGGNHAYYNVLDQWVGSTLPGAIMMRPLLGQEVWPTGMESAPASGMATMQPDWTAFPQPARDRVYIRSRVVVQEYRLLDAGGRTVSAGCEATSGIDLSALPSGTYFLQLRQGGMWGAARAITHP